MKDLKCILYHHVGEATEFEKGLNITTSSESFRKQIEYLSKHYKFISIDQVLSGNYPKNSLLITFDDTFKSVFDVVKGVLSPLGIPSVFFVNPGLIENQQSISLDRALTFATNKVGISRLCDWLHLPSQQDVNSLIGSCMSKYGSAERASILERLQSEYLIYADSAFSKSVTPEDLAQLLKHGAEIGNHTATHVHCRSLSALELQSEITEAKRKLEAWTNSKIRTFSIPYGNHLDLTPEVTDTVIASGHELIFLVHARSNFLRKDPRVFYRTSLHNEEPAKLYMQLFVKPILRSVLAKIWDRT